jgi:hypothetical protein
MESEGDPMTSDTPTPAEALAAVRRSRQAMADRLSYPVWYDVVYAACAGVLIAGQALPSTWSGLVSLVCAAVLLWIHHLWSQRTGLAVTGFTPGRARWVALGLGALLVALVAASGRLEEQPGLWWAPLALAPVAALAAHLASRLWMRVYRAELRAEA